MATYNHKGYGIVETNSETAKLSRQHSNRCAKNKTVFVSCKGEIREVSADMISEITN